MTTRRKPPGATSRNGYGTVHQARREQLEPLVKSGAIDCARCHEKIEPGQAWDLDHAPGKAGYLGASHRSCNRRAGADKTNAIRLRQRERPYITTIRLRDDQPEGSIVSNSDGTADVCLGNGQWETVGLDEARARYERAYYRRR